MRRRIFSVILFVWWTCQAIVLAQTYKDDIGWTALQLELDSQMLTGAGVTLSHVEAVSGGNYAPNPASFPGKTFTYPGGTPSGYSSHAANVGSYIYGASGVAPGITQITSFEANSWFQNGFLRSNSSFHPREETRDIANHSWIGSTGSSETDQTILQRLDYTIVRDDYLAVVGVNNGSVSSVPHLLSSAYNVLSVGVSSGNHSTGTTPVDEPGRVRPHIVAPASATSWGTAMVSGAGALLIEKARSAPEFANAERSVVLRALLMAGATKEGEEFGNNWERTPTRPLDDHYGAGELNIYNSYQILAGGEAAAGADATWGIRHWDYANSGDASTTYFLEIPFGYQVEQFSIMLVWDRIITPGSSLLWGSPGISLTDLNLYFYEAPGMVLGGLIDYSISTNENLEHIYLTSPLTAGTYAIVVENFAGPHVSYGIAWHGVEMAVLAIPEPEVAALLVMGFGLCLVTLKRVCA